MESPPDFQRQSMDKLWEAIAQLKQQVEALAAQLQALQEPVVKRRSKS